MVSTRPRSDRHVRLRRWLQPGRIEALLAACLAALSVLLEIATSQPWPVMLADLVAYAVAAATPKWPRAGAVVLGMILLSYLAMPVEWARMGEYALLIAILGAGMRGASRVRTVMSFCYWAILSALALQNAPNPSSAALASVAWAVLIALIWLVGNAFVAVTEAYQRAREADLVLQRQRLARELHDTVARSLTAVAMVAERARLHGGTTDAELTLITESAASGMQELRLMMNLLRGPVESEQSAVLAATPLDEALGRARNDLARNGFDLTLSIEGDLGRLRAEQAAVLGAATGEAVTNIIKHGDPAGPCGIGVDVADGGCELLFINRPRETDPGADSNGTLGLWGMRQRLAAIGGEVITERGDNWVTRLRLPLDSRSRSERVA